MYPRLTGILQRKANGGRYKAYGRWDVVSPNLANTLCRVEREVSVTSFSGPRSAKPQPPANRRLDELTLIARLWPLEPAWVALSSLIIPHRSTAFPEDARGRRPRRHRSLSNRLA